MRRRKAGTRGRPRKVKRGRVAKLQNSVPFETKLSEEEENLEDDQTTSLESDDAVTGLTGVIGLDKTGPYSYRVGSVNIELEYAGDDLKPVIQENDIKLEVECGSNTASMFLSRLCQGSKGSCIEFDGAWLTPNEFQFVSGRETAKDWKRSIRHFGRSLKLLITKGILTVHPAACRCDSCRLLAATTNEPKLVLEKRESMLREKAKGGSEGSVSGSDKEEGERGSDEDEAVDGSEDAGDESQDSAENGDEGSGDEDGGEEADEEGKIEENNNEAGEKESSSSSGSSSSDSSSSDSDSDSDEDEKKEEEEEEEEEAAETEETETKVDIHVQSETVFEEVSAVAAEAAAAAVVSPDQAGVEQEEQMEVDETEKDDEEEEEDENVEEDKEEDDVVDEEPSNDAEANPQDEEQEPEKEISEELEMNVEQNGEEKDSSDQEPEKDEDTLLEEVEAETESIQSPKDSNIPAQSPEPTDTTERDNCEEFKHTETRVPQQVASPEQTDEEKYTMKEETVVQSDHESVQDELLREPVPLKDEESRDSSSSIVTDSSRWEQSPVSSKVSTPTMENPMKKNVERSNSGGGKSRLSNIIDLLRTSKEKETQKQVIPDRPEEKRQEKRPLELREVKNPSPLPLKREEVKPRKPEREEIKPTRDDIKINEKAREAMRFPMGRLPFGFPPPDILERASRDAHEQLSKSHRQFEKNLESLIAQNMNPFIPELSIFSLPEHRAQMEYNYLKNMERLDQMAKERMATMAEMRHQQLIREHNSFVAKLAEQQHKTLRQEPERPREHVKKPVAPPKRREENPMPQTKVPHAHRAMPEVRKEKPDQRTLQTPPAAHHHQPTSRPPSTGSKPPSSLPLPASTARAAHPAGPSATQSRSSPMIAPIAPPLQMWSSCFPYVIPPPTIEMQRLTQFFPNLNGGLFSADTGTKRHTESPILDLSTKKRKMQMDARDHESRSKEPRLSSSSKSVHSSHANGLPRETLHHRSLSNKDSSAKERPAWANFDRNSALSCTCALQHLNDIRTWSVDDVCCFLKGLEGCTLYIDAFRRNRIDGNTLLLLTADTLMKSLGMKPGAARFLTDSVSKRARELQKLVPCEYCRMKIQKGQ